MSKKRLNRDQTLRLTEPNCDKRRDRSPGGQSRRRFLGQVGGLTTATVAASLTGLPSLTVRADNQTTMQNGLSKQESRAEQAMQIRNQAAQTQRKLPFSPQPVNNDEELYPNRIANYSKALPHNELGEVDLKAYEILVRAVTTCSHDDYEDIPLGGSTKLANPQAALSFEMEGIDPHYFSIAPPPRFNSAEQAAEIIELYWQAVARDVPFAGYDENQYTNQATVELSRLARFRGPKLNERVTTSTLFRGSMTGDLIGPYLSQFLVQDIPYGAMTIPQRYRVPEPENDHMTDYPEWLSIQNGGTTIANWLGETPVYLRNGRDLAAWVHKDFSYQAFLSAALIMLGWGQPALDPYNPYVGSATQGAFCTFGGPYVLDLVARVANAALKASWYQKWQVHRRLRPEEFAGRVHNRMTKAAGYEINDEVLNASVLEIINNKHDTYLLPQAYPEGCPTHPAYPAGHAVIAGACVTALKAFFNESFAIPSPVVASEDGLSLTALQGNELKIGGELNKLASNISFGRNFAGIHWRSDGVEGLKLGEAVAIGIMADLKSTCHERFKGFRLTKFDGTMLII